MMRLLRVCVFIVATLCVCAVIARDSGGDDIDEMRKRMRWSRKVKSLKTGNKVYPFEFDDNADRIHVPFLMRTNDTHIQISVRGPKGSTFHLHPMDADHYIRSVWIVHKEEKEDRRENDKASVLYFENIMNRKDAETTFRIPNSARKMMKENMFIDISPFIACNLHGVFEGLPMRLWDFSNFEEKGFDAHGHEDMEEETEETWEEEEEEEEEKEDRIEL
eukprot:g682.t1